MIKVNCNTVNKVEMNELEKDVYLSIIKKDKGGNICLKESLPIMNSKTKEFHYLSCSMWSYLYHIYCGKKNNKITSYSWETYFHKHYHNYPDKDKLLIIKIKWKNLLRKLLLEVFTFS